MLENHLRIFVGAVNDMLTQLGVGEIDEGMYTCPESAFEQRDLLVIIGLVRDIRGRIIYRLSSDLAMSITSSMLGGISVDTIDDMANSAICEFANMVSGMAVSMFPSGIIVDITPPTLVSGQELTISVGRSDILMNKINTSFGFISVYLALDVKPQ